MSRKEIDNFIDNFTRIILTVGLIYTLVMFSNIF